MALVAIASSLSIGVASQENGRLWRGKNDKYTVVVARAQKTNGTGHPQWAVVIHEPGGVVRNVRLEGFVAGVIGGIDDVTVVGDRALVRGPAGPGGGAFIVDLARGEVVDDFLYSNGTLSPTGRFFQLLEFRRRDDADDASVYRVYDVSGPGVGRGSRDPAKMPIPSAAGARIFPPAGDDATRWALGAPIWVGDNHVAFAEWAGRTAAVTVHVVEIGSGGAAVADRTASIPLTADIVSSSAIDPGRTAAEYMRVEDIRFVGDSRFRVRFQQNAVLKVRYVDVEVRK